LGAGLVLGLAASPCVSAPLAALLLAIAATGDWLLGGLALFAFAWGMSALLIAAGIFPSLLARPGPWMLRVKAAFGAILAAMGCYFVRNVLPGWLFGLAAVLLALAAGIVLLVAGSRLAEGTRRRGLVRGLGGVALVLGAYLAFGAALGSGLFLTAARAVMPAAVGRRICPRTGALAWEPYSPAALAAAAAAGRPAVLDFYANWCAACQELEEGAFADPRVAVESRRFVRLRLDGSDVAAPPVKAAQERFHILGYPTAILFRADGSEAGRVIGAASPDEFLAKLRAAR
jgi:thiol:disulfide interchange protein DsbD